MFSAGIILQSIFRKSEGQLKVESFQQQVTENILSLFQTILVVKRLILNSCGSTLTPRSEIRELSCFHTHS